MRLIVSGDADPYDAGTRIWAEALGRVPDCPGLMYPTWLIWGALTDWVEVKPEETDLASQTIRRAAQEWLLLPDIPGIREAYFERWMYEELGYERPGGEESAR